METNRFETSATKLYNAFNEKRLNQNSCAACAVGNLLGHKEWFGSSNFHWDKDIVNIGLREKIRILKDNNDSGYTIEELTRVEQIFLDSFVGLLTEEEHQPEHQYKALMNVLEYLAELDNVKDYTNHEKAFKEVLDRECETVKTN